MSSQIIEDQATWADRLFSCKCELGYPSGYLELQIETNNKFEPFLSLNETRNNNAFIVSSTTQEYSENCTAYTEFTFAFSRILLNYHLQRLRCVMYPPDEFKEKEIQYSEVKEIQVVRSRYTMIKYSILFLSSSNILNKIKLRTNGISIIIISLTFISSTPEWFRVRIGHPSCPSSRNRKKPNSATG